MATHEAKTWDRDAPCPQVDLRGDVCSHLLMLSHTHAALHCIAHTTLRACSSPHASCASFHGSQSQFAELQKKYDDNNRQAESARADLIEQLRKDRQVGCALDSLGSPAFTFSAHTSSSST